MVGQVTGAAAPGEGASQEVKGAHHRVASARWGALRDTELPAQPPEPAES